MIKDIRLNDEGEEVRGEGSGVRLGCGRVFQTQIVHVIQCIMCFACDYYFEIQNESAPYAAWTSYMIMAYYDMSRILCKPNPWGLVMANCFEICKNSGSSTNTKKPPNPTPQSLLPSSPTFLSIFFPKLPKNFYKIFTNYY